MQYFHIFHVVDAMLLVDDVVYGGIVGDACQEFGEVEQGIFLRFPDDQVRPSDDVIHPLHADFGKVFANLLRQEGEEVH